MTVALLILASCSIAPLLGVATMSHGRAQSPATQPQDEGAGRTPPIALTLSAARLRTTSDAALEAGPRDFCCPDYLTAILQEVSRHWQSAQQATGEVVVRFSIETDGRPIGVALERTSGLAGLDKASERAVEASRFPPLPAQLTDRRPLLHLTFVYEAGGSAPALAQALRNLERYTNEQATAPATTVEFNAKGVDFGPWLRRFTAQVKRNWNVPAAVATLRGRVVVKFVIEQSGAIRDVTVHEPSGVEAFDRASFGAILLSNPTVPLPAGYPDPIALFTITFHYNQVPTPPR